MSNYGWSTGTTGYDDEDRLVSWTRDDNNLSQSWTLTSEGDWSQFVENTNTETRTHGPAHELTAIGSTALSYDPKGNLTVDNTKNHGYTWDFDNRMSAADTDGDSTDDVTLKYDARGRRIAKTSGTTTTVYVLAGWQVVAEYSSDAAPSSPTEKYVYAFYIDEPVLKDGTGGTVYYHRNSQYSVSALTNASGAVVERYGYEPYGELTILAADGSTVRASSTYANSYTYTGRRWDAELKLYYFRARYYDPGLGRFMGRDPLGYVDGGLLYEAMRGTPVVLVDSRGTKAFLVEDPLTGNSIDLPKSVCRTDKENDERERSLEQLPVPDTLCCEDIIDAVWESDLVRSCRATLRQRAAQVRRPRCGDPADAKPTCDDCQSNAYYSPTQHRIVACRDPMMRRYAKGNLAGIKRTFCHELVHAWQSRACRSPSEESPGVSDCQRSLRKEIQAYYCATGCQWFEECLRRALGSSCPNYCDPSKMTNLSLQQEIEDLFRWAHAFVQGGTFCPGGVLPPNEWHLYPLPDSM